MQFNFTPICVNVFIFCCLTSSVEKKHTKTLAFCLFEDLISICLISISCIFRPGSLFVPNKISQPGVGGGWGGEFAVTKDRWIKTAMHKPAEQTRQHKDDVVVNKVCLH